MFAVRESEKEREREREREREKKNIYQGEEDSTRMFNMSTSRQSE